MMSRRLLKKWPLAAAVLLALLSVFSVWRMLTVADTLVSQQAAERWQGGGSLPFAQISCFLPGGEKLSLDQIHSFRNDMAAKLKAASLAPEENPGLYRDAWSAFGSVKAGSGRRSGVCRVVAVGGGFFDFHPLCLLSGSYPREEDIMDDRVLLDEEAAWLLFGGTDLTGMSFSLEGVPFVVAGVYAHEDDSFSRLASEGEMCIYMSWSAYQKLFPDSAAIGFYELVMAEPVKGFAFSSVREKFPIRTAEIVDNSRRFELSHLWKTFLHPETSSMHLNGAVYPYWENAARAAEVRAARWLGAAVIFGALPLALLVFALFRTSIRSKHTLEEEIIPKARERAEEAVRRYSRRRWEKRHPEQH